MKNKTITVLYFGVWLKSNLSMDKVHINELLTNLQNENVKIIDINPINKYTNKEHNNLTFLRIWELFSYNFFVLSSIISGSIYTLKGLIILIKYHKNIDIVYERNSPFYTGYFLAHLFNKPIIKEVNGIRSIEIKSTNNNYSKILRIIEILILKKSDHYITVTHELKNFLTNVCSIDKKIIVIYNGANTKIFKPLDKNYSLNKIKLRSNYKYICFVGSFQKWHGLHILLKSFKEVLQINNNIRLLLVGYGPYFNDILKLADDLGIKNYVHFIGSVKNIDVPYYINASEFCILPTIPENYIEYSPLKLCEYLACGKPVVTSNLPGINFIKEIGAGLSVEANNVEELTKAMKVMILMDEASLQKMGNIGKKYVIDYRSWSIVAKKVKKEILFILKT